MQDITLDGGSIDAANTGGTGNNLFVDGDIFLTNTTQTATIDGKLDFRGDGTKEINVSTGSTNVDTGAQLQLQNVTIGGEALTLGTSNILTDSMDLNVSGTGTFAMAGGINETIDQLNVSNGALDVDGILTLNGGTLSGGTGVDSTGELNLTAGNTLNITGDFNFGGTLALAGDGTQFDVDGLRVTGNTVIDFGAGVATEFNIGAFEIDGTTTAITVNNWVSFQDLWTAASFEGGFGTVGLDVRDNNTAQITFNGFTPSDTIWLTFDFDANEITVPEPSSYGAIMMALSLGTWLARRPRRTAAVGLDRGRKSHQKEACRALRARLHQPTRLCSRLAEAGYPASQPPTPTGGFRETRPTSSRPLAAGEFPLEREYRTERLTEFVLHVLNLAISPRPLLVRLNPSAFVFRNNTISEGGKASIGSFLSQLRPSCLNRPAQRCAFIFDHGDNRHAKDIRHDFAPNG